MDTQTPNNNSDQMHGHKKNFFKFLKIFIIVLIIFVGLKSINTIKEFRYIGKGTVAVNVITVSGKGEVMAKPDIANFSFSITEEGKTAKEAQDKATAKSNPAIQAIKDAGVEDKDIKTTSYDLSPKYEYVNTDIVCVRYPCTSQKQTIIGYTLNQSVSVKVRKIDGTSAIIAKLTSFGISNISGINFVIDDSDTLTEQAKGAAIADAQAKAKVLAKQLGVSLGKVVSFSEQGNGGYYPMYATDSMMGSVASKSAPTPDLPAGENKITSNVSITYEID